MMNDELTDNFILDLLDESKVTIPEQFGPLRWFDKEMRCASRGCGSPTYSKLEGIPYCMMHTLRLMNEMLIKGMDANSNRSPNEFSNSFDEVSRESNRGSGQGIQPKVINL